MNKTLKLTVFLAVVAALATGVLAAVNSVTAPIIAQNEAGAQTVEIQKLYPDAKEFTLIDFDSDEKELVQEVFKVDDNAYVFKVASKGFDSDIIFLIGYDNDGSNSKFKILTNNDTPGFGQRLMEDSYHDNMTGKSTSDPVDMISGVTVSSNAVKNGVAAAVSVFNSLTGSSSVPSEPEVEEPGKIVISELEGGDLVETIEDGNLVTYTIEVDGFKGVNTVEVTIDMDSRTVKSLTLKKLNDTVELQENYDNEAFVNQFAGLNIDDLEAEIDAVSGVTSSVNSIVKAVNLAMTEARNRE